MLYQAQNTRDFTTFEKDSKLFIKFFLLDASVNVNKFGVVWEAVKQFSGNFVGKPFIIMPNFGHPHPADAEMMFEAQAPYKKGTITEVGFDEPNRRAWAVAEITDPEAMQLIQDGKIRFVSPSILAAHDEIMRDAGNNVWILKFEAAHVAGVKNPAYGTTAQIKGACACNGGNCDSCKKEMRMIQSSVDEVTQKKQYFLASVKNKISISSAMKKKKYQSEDEMKILQGEISQDLEEYLKLTQISYSGNSECVSQCLQAKKDAGKEIDDQAVAICYSECGYNSEADKMFNCCRCTEQFQSEEMLMNHIATIHKISSDTNSYNNSSSNEEIMSTTGQETQQITQKDIQEMNRKLETLSATVETQKGLIETLKTQNAELKSAHQAELKKPLIEHIMEAKKSLNIQSEKDEERLEKLEVSDLKVMSAEFDKLLAEKTNQKPFTRFPAQASTDEEVKSGDALLSKLHPTMQRSKVK